MGAVLRVRRAMPLTFVGNQFGGFRASGWAWLLNLVVLAPLVLSGPLPVRAVRRLSPYLAFLGLCGPILAYVLAWRAADRADQVLDILLRLGCHPHRRADAQSQVNSVRRREAWPALIEACSDAPITATARAPRRRSARTSPAAASASPQRLPASLLRHGTGGQHPALGFFLAAGVRSVLLAVRGADRQLHAAAGLLVVAFLLFA